MTSFMLADFPLQFDRPWLLLLLLLLIPVALMARASVSSMGRTASIIAVTLRSIIILLLTASLAEPHLVRRGEGVTTTIILDRSQSVPLLLKSDAQEFLREATEYRQRDEDRIAVITVARDAAISAMPDSNSRVSADIEPGDLTATNLATAVRLALAIMPEDTANRIVLASDGNETIDNVLAAADLARANGVPVDIVVLQYEHANEVMFDRIIAPARARLGQSVNLKLVLRGQSETTGRVVLTMNDETLDLNGDEAGNSLPVAIEPGPNVIPLTLSLDDTGPQTFEAVFEPDIASADMINDNNRAMAVTFVGAEGKVLVIDEDSAETASFRQAMVESEIAIDRLRPADLTDGLVQLAGYDAVVIANVPRYAFDESQVRELHAFVHDLGGGLIMLGGDQSFGAGGWIDSDVAKALPVKLDPPQSRQMVRGALAMIMHSCEMPQGNFWAQKTAESAITALSRLDYCGIIEYSWNAAGQPGINNCVWAFPMQPVGDKVAAITATKQLTMGDMPDFAPSMQLALQGLMGVTAGKRHLIIISDGDPQPPSAQLLTDYKRNRVSISTVMVGGHGTTMDRTRMQNVAEATGGEFHNVLNPRKLPEIFIKEAEVVSRSLIQEGEYAARVTSRLPGPTEGYDMVPGVRGYVVTAMREGLAQVPIVIPTKEANDPLFAYWNYGLGRSIAFTSDLRGRWGTQWVPWSQFRGFWEQAVRWVMRQHSPRNLMLTTAIDGERAVIDLEALDSDTSFFNFMQFAETTTVVLDPEGEATPLTLQQVGPGRYRGSFEIDSPGAYLVNVQYRGQSEGETQSGYVQAAVTVPYAREYRAVRDNAALLKRLRDETNGREFDLAQDPTLVNLFDRSELEVPRSLKDVWDLMIIIAAMLFVLDVAVRRLRVDRAWLAGVAGRLLGREAQVGTGTVAAWKRARAQSATRQPRDQPGVRFDADDVRTTSIDVGAEIASSTDDPPKRPAARTPPGSIDDEESSGMSRLLEAKRRAARERHNEDDDTSNG